MVLVRPATSRQWGGSVLYLAADRAGGITAGFDMVPDALGALRGRLIALAAGLDAEGWGGPSRCELWTAHDVVRHVRDACRVHISGLHRDLHRPLDEPFDNRTTPRHWLESSAGQPPERTLEELRRLSADEADALVERMECPDQEMVSAPYGQIPWTLLSAHVLWDAWLHERDVAQLAPGGLASTLLEDPLVAHYALFLASMPAVGRGHDFAVTVALESRGRHYSASVVPGHVELHDSTAAVDADLRGELSAVVDSLAGRGPCLGDVIDGDAAKGEPLTWLRPMLAPSG